MEIMQGFSEESGEVYWVMPFVEEQDTDRDKRLDHRTINQKDSRCYQSYHVAERGRRWRCQSCQVISSRAIISVFICI